MRILISAFACSPLWGSEPAVGWNWACELARAHEVRVLTHAHFRAHIEPACADAGAPRLEPSYLDLPLRRGQTIEQALNSPAYYMRWQQASRAVLQRLVRAHGIELVHHLTWGNLRLPPPLQGLGVPVVVGPMGGGERAPFSLYRGLPWPLRLKELARDLSIAGASLDPRLRRGLRDARLVLCRTGQTLAALPAALRARACVVHDIGAPSPGELPPRTPGVAGRLECLFVGRLLAWKGPQFALQAIALLRARGIDARLTLVGEGELAPHLHQLALRLGLGAALRWKSRLAREEVLALYATHDVFVFPSLHDSGGTVVLESLSRGCPVVCVDLGGPPHFVTPDSGRVVQASDGDALALPGRLAQALAPLAQDPALRERLRAGALRQARHHAWAARVEGAYRQVQRALQSPA